MKVRILDQSIRFRISMDEMALLAENGELFSTTTFPNGHLSFQVQSHDRPNQIDIQDQKCLLMLNRVQLLNLHESESITIDFIQKELKVLFEKDFQCLTERTENEENLFSNPRSSH